MTNSALVAFHATVLMAVTQYKPVQRAFNILTRDPRGSDLQVVTPEIREEVVLMLRRSAHGLNPETGNESDLHRDSGALVVLLRLGDMEMIEEMMREYHETPGAWCDGLGRRGQPLIGLHGWEFSDSGQPLLIPYLAREFFRDDLDPATVEEVNSSTAEGGIERTGAPASVASAYFAIGILKMSPVFTPAVRDWAKKADLALLIEYGRDIFKYRQVMQQWWRDNAKHFEAKDYAAVQPGAPLVSSLVAQTPPASPEPIQPPTLGAGSPRSQTPSEEPALASSPSIGFLWTSAAAVLALLAGLLVFWKRRSH